MRSSKTIRTEFLEFFRSKSHLIVDSSPIVAKDDPTLMFTNAGMNQFKDSFLGTKTPASPRIADTQKCLRISGKHNDLEDVGHDTYHLTMFEMLGNWSFGDYFKAESIDWAWELLTEVYQIPQDRLYTSYYEGDPSQNIPMDTEARDLWKKYLSEDRILPFGKENFWSMGDTGPCGPCSEIHVDIRPDSERARVDGRTLVNNDHPQVIEIWNLVFMEFNKKADGSLEFLPAKSVDTGMGFERLCMVLQGVASVYDTEVFAPIKAHIEQATGIRYGDSHETDVAIRVVMDHIRSICFTMTDGAMPSNTGPGYAVRRLLRRASRYGYKFLGQHKPFLHRLVPVFADIFDGVFPGVREQRDLVQRIVEAEEASFLRTLARGQELFEEHIATSTRGDKQIDPQFAFTLFDTFGFPFDLTALMAREKGWTADEPAFKALMEEQKARSRAASSVKTGDWVEIENGTGLTPFTGYDNLSQNVRILRYRTQSTAKGDLYQIVLNETPFYPEGGGQVGDTGTLVKGMDSLNVLDTRRENELIVHIVDKLPENPEGDWFAQVDAERRRLSRANHSATHLLHAALREVLGKHVEQKGSLVSPELLRFDFSHTAKMTDDELARVEKIVNDKIAAAIPLDERRDVPLAEAKSLGAMALFGEKYGEKVRVIVFDPAWSVELCGGTHVRNTAEIRLFRIVSEGSVAAGIRRVEAYTSEGALNWLQAQADTLTQVNELLRNPKDSLKALNDLLQKNREMEKEIEKMNREKVGDLQTVLRGKAREMGGVNLLNEVVEVPNAGELKNLAFNLRNSMQNALIVLGAIAEGKPSLHVILTEDLEKTGRFHAGNLVRELAREIEGGGGGQAFYASAGGKNPDGIAAAVKKVESLIG